ncbi:MAG: tetratricopeptide repeat protein [Limisphaerales bacterium]
MDQLGYQTAVSWLLIATLLYLRAQDGAIADSTRLISYWLAVVAYALATITYPIVLGFPALLIAVDFFPMRRFTLDGRLRLISEPGRKAWMSKIPFILIAASMVAFTLYGRYRFTEYWIKPAEMEDFGLGARGMQAAYVWAYYVWKPLLPTDLSPVYTTLIWNEPLDLPFVASLLLVVGISAVLILGWRRWPAVLAIWIAHIGLLIPMLGLTERPHYTHDRYGIINGALWPMLLVALAIHPRSRLTFRKWAPIFGIGLLVICGAISFRQTHIWKNDIRFFSHMSANLGANQYRNLAQMNLGEALMTAGRDEEAVACFEVAAERNVLWISPFDFQRLALSHGSALLNLERWPEAEAKFREILAANPEHVPARNNVALALWKSGNLAEAIIELQTVITQRPDHPEGHLNLASLLIEAGRGPDAIPHLEQARALGADPEVIATKLNDLQRQ